jgi:hypothetical protein
MWRLASQKRSPSVSTKNVTNKTENASEDMCACEKMQD